MLKCTVLPLYNADVGVHSVDRVIAKLLYNRGAFAIEVMGKVHQWEPWYPPCYTRNRLVMRGVIKREHCTYINCTGKESVAMIKIT